MGGKNWKKVSEILKNRSPIQCLHRWSKILKPGLIKGPWTIQEDQKLIEWIKKEGPQSWTKCANKIFGRSGKQCRERYLNILSPKIKKGFWTAVEDYNIFQAYNQYGSKWSHISAALPGRSENSVKNRFYSTLRKHLNQIRLLDADKKNKWMARDVNHNDKIAEEISKIAKSAKKCKVEDLLLIYPAVFETLKEDYNNFIKDKKNSLENDLKINKVGDKENSNSNVSNLTIRFKKSKKKTQKTSSSNSINKTNISLNNIKGNLLFNIIIN